MSAKNLGCRGFVLGYIGLLMSITTGRADAPALPQAEQAMVNQAIDRGVHYLKASQGQQGAWASAGNKHIVGYTSLCGLTLLECGEPRLDAAIDRTAQFVRQAALSVDTTYELALAILFLDRFGVESDRPLIQALAARLMGGQTATGGWGYKCPTLTATQREMLLNVLRQLERRPHIPADLLVQIGRPGLEIRKQQNTFDGPRGLRQLAIPGIDRPSVIERSPDSPGGTPTGTVGTKEPSVAIETQRYDAAAIPGGPLSYPRRGTCIKIVEGRSSEPLEDKKKEPKEEAKALPPVFIPPQVQGVPAVVDPRRIVLLDPEGRAHEPLMASTDNSNTQFALLALWAARRHNVPVRRSLNLLAVRYATSQNPDGSWSYKYVFGGDGQGSGPMNAVGMLGLAVGHNLAHEGRLQDRDRMALHLKDPMLVAGLTSLGRHIGNPTGALEQLYRGQPVQVAQPNLYFLWSVERVGMLYNLKEIGGKEWYRWGAETLVVNQQPQGHWTKGGFPGSDPVLDTCMALLFLKRVNLAKDIAKELPFGEKEPKRSTENVATVDSPKPMDLPKPPETPPEPTKKEELPSRQLEQGTTPPAPPPSQATPGNASLPTPPAVSGKKEEKEEGSSTALLGIVFAVLAAILLAASAFFLMRNKKSSASVEPEDEEEEQPKPRPKKVKSKTKAAS